MKAPNLTHILRKKSNIDPQLILGGGSFLVTFLNPYSYALSRNNSGLLAEFDAIYIDGISLVWLMKLLGMPCRRLSFDMTSMAKDLFEQLNLSGESIYFMGSKEAEVAASAERFQSEYPSMNIVGYRNGYFSNDAELEIALLQIIQTQPRYVVVGMGTPMQEQVLIKLKSLGFKGTAFTCGGFLHQSSEGVKYYPKFYDKFNLRWLYRIIDEPKLLRRYALDYPKGFALFLYDFFR